VIVAGNAFVVLVSVVMGLGVAVVEVCGESG
jgi:hypothetical protein